jgi:hypothetical protein
MLYGFDIWWLAPRSLDTRLHSSLFPAVLMKRYPDPFFDGTRGYNRLLLGEVLYSDFSGYSHILICQTDAVILRPHLRYWLDRPYDYLGAPWRNGCTLQVDIPEIPVPGGVRCFTFVGNGGLSLRRNRACLGLLREFPTAARRWFDAGYAEDLFFGLLGSISREFLLPNVMTAALFSHDKYPEYLDALTGGQVPFGAHAWALYNRGHWEGVFRKLDLFTEYSSIIRRLDS